MFLVFKYILFQNYFTFSTIYSNYTPVNKDFTQLAPGLFKLRILGFMPFFRYI